MLNRKWRIKGVIDQYRVLIEQSIKIIDRRKPFLIAYHEAQCAYA